MKLLNVSKSLVCLTIFLFTGLASFAQKDDADDLEKMLTGFVAEYNKDPYKFFSERLADDFRYIDDKGVISDRDQVLKRNEGRKSLNSSVSDVKFFKDGNLVVSSGYHTFEGTKLAFTYTWIKRQDKWYFLASQHTAVADTK